MREFTDGRGIFLSTLRAGRAERRLALRVVLVSVVIFLVAAPFARMPLAQIWAFIPIYESTLVINDLITAALLYGQFSFLRSRALLVLASGYLFTAFCAVAHALTFPGVFSSSGLLGAGPQTTAWLYMFWHGGFPLFVIAYSQLKDSERERKPLNAPFPVVYSGGVVLILVCGLTLVATVGHGWLPAIMHGNVYTAAMIAVVTSVWVLSLLALAILWRRRPHTVLDLWLMVVSCAWLFDIALSAVLNAGRFDLGFYAGRIYGLLAASFVLIVLLTENNLLYARLIGAHARERHARRRVEEKTSELISINGELESFSYSVSHDLRAPLRAIDGYSRILEEEHARNLDNEGRRILGVVRNSSEKMGELIDALLMFSRLGRQPLAALEVDMNGLVGEIIVEIEAVADGAAAGFAVAKLPPAWGDRVLLRQVWINLVSNAVKFSRNARNSKIEIGVSSSGTENAYWVRDSGVGFDMRYYDRLFGVFKRLHGTDEFPGTGVGLAIVQRIVTRHGGRVWAESKTGEGAIFYFALPALNTDLGPALEVKSPDSEVLGSTSPLVSTQK